MKLKETHPNDFETEKEFWGKGQDVNPKRMGNCLITKERSWWTFKATSLSHFRITFSFSIWRMEQTHAHFINAIDKPSSGHILIFAWRTLTLTIEINCSLLNLWEEEWEQWRRNCLPRDVIGWFDSLFNAVSLFHADLLCPSSHLILFLPTAFT